MTDTSQGADWWQASDGKWYPPHLLTGPAPSPEIVDAPPIDSPGSGLPDADSESTTGRRPGRSRKMLFAVVASALVLLLVAAVVLALALGSNKTDQLSGEIISVSQSGQTLLIESKVTNSGATGVSADCAVYVNLQKAHDLYPALFKANSETNARFSIPAGVGRLARGTTTVRMSLDSGSIPAEVIPALCSSQMLPAWSLTCIPAHLSSGSQTGEKVTPTSGASAVAPTTTATTSTGGMVVAPQVYGLTASEATKKLQEAGFVVQSQVGQISSETCQSPGQPKQPGLLASGLVNAIYPSDGQTTPGGTITIYTCP